MGSKAKSLKSKFFNILKLQCTYLKRQVSVNLRHRVLKLHFFGKVPGHVRELQAQSTAHVFFGANEWPVDFTTQGGQLVGESTKVLDSKN